MKMTSNKKLTLVCAVLTIALLTGFCSRKYSAARKNLEPQYKDFLKEVRYIIKKHEKKVFYSLATDEERAEFVEDFWAKRDPNPSTDENEFKIMYYERIAEANNLFRGDGGAGWLSDRGRIYILLGPPEHRQFNPGRVHSEVSVKNWYNKPHEIWYYGTYPIIFVDRLENGSMEIRPLSNQHLTTILRTTLEWKPKVGKGGKIPYDFAVKLKGPKDGLFTLKVRIPYKNILFQPKNDHFGAELTLLVTIFDKANKKMHHLRNTYNVSMTEAELLNAKDDLKYDVPFTVELPKGKYQLEAVMKSESDDLKTRKKLKFSI